MGNIFYLPHKFWYIILEEGILFEMVKENLLTGF